MFNREHRFPGLEQFFYIVFLISDCDNPPTKVGYLYDTPTGTAKDHTVSVTGCDTDNGYSGTPNPASLTCDGLGSWTDVNGCYILGVWVELLDNEGECVHK